MRVQPYVMEQLGRVRDGFMIVDLVLKETMREYARGTADEEQVLFALQQHRESYEGYLQELYQSLVPSPEAWT